MSLPLNIVLFKRKFLDIIDSLRTAIAATQEPAKEVSCMHLDQLILRRVEDVLGDCARLLKKRKPDMRDVMPHVFYDRYGLLQYAHRVVIHGRVVLFEDCPPIEEAMSYFKNDALTGLDTTESWVGFATELVTEYFDTVISEIGESIDDLGEAKERMEEE